MILGIGIDSVEIERFVSWQTLPPEKLSKVFSSHEIAYCAAVPAKGAERFAARFAAKEATLKALSQALPDQTFTLMAICKAVEIIATPNGAPVVEIDWEQLNLSPDEAEPLSSLLTITHTQTTATAVILIQSAL